MLLRIVPVVAALLTLIVLLSAADRATNSHDGLTGPTHRESGLG